jgi:hypothetical protein
MAELLMLTRFRAFISIKSILSTNTRKCLKEKINYPQINADEHRFKLINMRVHLRLSVGINSF